MILVGSEDSLLLLVKRLSSLEAKDAPSSEIVIRKLSFLRWIVILGSFVLNLVASCDMSQALLAQHEVTRF